MRIQLSDHFTYKRLLRFVVSPIMMMIFTSLYSIVDGFFVSNYVGKTPFAAVNLIMPVCMGIGTIGTMIGTGGRETRTGKPLFFHACLFCGSFKRGVIRDWICLCTPDCHCIRCDR